MIFQQRRQNLSCQYLSTNIFPRLWKMGHSKLVSGPELSYKLSNYIYLRPILIINPMHTCMHVCVYIYVQGGSNMTRTDFFFLNHNCQTLTCTCQSSTYSPPESTHFFQRSGSTLMPFSTKACGWWRIHPRIVWMTASRPLKFTTDSNNSMGKSVSHGPVCLSGVSASEGRERMENEPHDRRTMTPSSRLLGSGYAANHKPFLKRASGCFQNVGKNVLTLEGSTLKTDMCK